MGGTVGTAGTLGLKRGLSLYHMVIFGLLFVIPIAPFGIYGILHEASGGFVPTVYIIGAFAMIFTALSYGAMARSFPIAGSVYSYVSHGVNPHFGFVAGWIILLDYILMPTLIYVVVGISINAIFPNIPIYAWSAIVIAIITILNTIGVESTARIAMVALILEMIIYLLFVGFAIYAISRGVNGAVYSIDPFYNAKTFKFAMVMSAASIAILSFLGFDAISTLVEETKGDSRNVGRASVLVLSIAASLFVFLTFIASILWGDKVFNNIDYAFYEIAGMAGGEWLLKLTSLGTALSWGGAGLTAQLAVSRVLYAMSRDGNIPSFFGHLHKRFKTPYVAAWLMAVLSLILCYFYSDKVEDLTLLVNFGALSSFIILHFSVIIFYSYKKKSKDYFFHLVCPLVGILIVSYVWMSLKTQTKLLGFTWIALGILWYAVLTLVFKKRVKFREM